METTINDTTPQITKEEIQRIAQVQRDFFATNRTKEIAFRKTQLKKLKALIEDNEDAIVEVLHKDLHKHEFESYATEIGFVLVDLDKTIASLKSWAAPKKVKTPLFMQVASSKIQSEPYGNTLIIAPWNYPVQLLIAPLIGAIAAGNTAILKPSEYAQHTSALFTRLLNNAFDENYIKVIEGAVTETQFLLEEKFDYIFFTGSTNVGKIVYQAAAKHLTPVTLELGGKSPCIVDNDIHLERTAKRIVWGKFVNVGQTCIAPDYLLVNERIKAALVKKIQFYIKEFFGDNPQQSDSLGRIINERHFDRLIGYLENGKIITGGQHDKSDRYIAPTLLDKVNLDSPVMEEEIFGPILPIIEYNNLREAIDFIKARPKPLALYIFSKNDKKIDRILSETSSGGACINDTLMHIANPHLPFGGVGQSGIGAYHGQSSFDLFSHQKSVLHRSFMVEEPIRYAPYKLKRSWLKKLMDWTL
jgi:acyl-CoA reductase-like NAD-dependent aldehyde dehydrogenase